MAKRINRDDVDKFHDYSLYIPTRTIYIGSEEHNIENGESGTDGAMAERVIKNLTILDTKDEPINVIMNNIGGDVNHGLAIYDAIKACKSHVAITVFGHCMSMGSIILQAADVRIMSENSVQMIHYGVMGAEGHAKTVYKQADENKRIDKWMETMYLEKIKEKQEHYTLARLQRMLAHDTFITARESVNLGLCDQILGEEK